MISSKNTNILKHKKTVCDIDQDVYHTTRKISQTVFIYYDAIIYFAST